MKGYEIMVKGPLGWQPYTIDGEVIRFRTYQDALDEIREALPVDWSCLIRDIATGKATGIA